MFSLERIQRLAFGSAFLFFAFYILRRGLSGATLWLSLGGLLLITGFIFIVLKDRYWIIIPVAMMSGLTALSIFGRNIRVVEMAVIFSFAFFLMHAALSRQNILHINPSISWPVFLHMLWVAAIYAINPVGLAILGSEAIGARFYFLILLGFLAFVVLSMQKVSERDARLIIVFALLTSAFAPIQRYTASVQSSMALDGEAFYTWHQSLRIPASLLLSYLLVRYRRFTPVTFVVYGLVLAIVLLSGKRAALVIALIYPALAALVLHRNMNAVVFRTCAILAIIVFLIVAGGIAKSMPLVAQRALAIIPGPIALDSRFDTMNEDRFRQGLYALAYEEIRRNPFLGRRGYAMRLDESFHLYLSTLGSRNPFYGHGYSSNWHSTWIGLWVDFGLPAVIFYAAFCIVMLRTALRIYHRLPPNSFLRVLVGMIVLRFIGHLITSYTGGHSALVPLYQWWGLGLLIAVERGFKQSNRSDQPVPESLPDLQS